MTTITVGSRVQITTAAEPITFRGKCGTVYAHLPSRIMGEWHVQIDGVPGDLGRCSFRESELIRLMTLVDALNNEDEAVAVATNAAGVTVEVTYWPDLYGEPKKPTPFWIFQEVKDGDLEEGPLDFSDVHHSFDYDEMCEYLLVKYDLDAEAAIWTRKQAERVEA